MGRGLVCLLGAGAIALLTHCTSQDSTAPRLGDAGHDAAQDAADAGGPVVCSGSVTQACASSTYSCYDTYAAALAACARGADFSHSAQPCSGYDLVASHGFDNGQTLFFDHASGALVAIDSFGPGPPPAFGEKCAGPADFRVPSCDGAAMVDCTRNANDASADAPDDTGG